MSDGTVKCIEDEIPFDVPDTWAWCRFKAIFSSFITGPFGTMLHQSDYVPQGTPLVNPMNIINGRIVANSKMLVDADTVNRLSSFMLIANDIVIGRRGEMGRCAVVTKQQEGWLCGTGSFAIRLSSMMNPSFFSMVLTTEYIVSHLTEKSIGSTMCNLNQTILCNLLVPIPPQKEQKMIIDTILTLNSVVERIESEKADLESIITQAKSRILDLAIRGKLVPQNPDDEPASVLLECIRAEKEALIKQGKIKRDKNESFIFRGDDKSYYEKVGNSVRCITAELPFEVPDSWSYVRLGTAMPYEQPQAYIVDSTDYCDGYPTPVLTAGKSFIIGYTNEISGIKTELPVVIFDDFTTDSKYVDFLFKVKSSAMKILTADSSFADSKFFFYVMQTIECNHSTHKRYWISDFSQKIVPLPPLQEQKRIVSVLEAMEKEFTAITEGIN